MTIATTTGPLRLRDLRPERVARDVCTAVLDDLLKKTHLVGGTGSIEVREPVVESPLYRSVYALARYAIEGKPESFDVARFEETLAALYTSPLEPRQAPYEPEPGTPYGLCVLAAKARAKIRERAPLSSPELAVLLGVDRDYVNGLASNDGIPGAYRDTKLPRSPWRFKGAAFRTYLDERGL